MAFPFDSSIILTDSSCQLIFGDGDTYLYESADDIVDLYTGSTGLILHIDGPSHNFIFGDGSGNLGTESGTYNIILGSNSGAALTTGGNNILIGRYSGAAVSSSSAVIAIGQYAFQNSTVVGVALGQYALQNYTSGGSSMAFGNSAGRYSSGGFRNTYIGTSSGEGQSGSYNTGGDNVFIGYFSGRYATTSGYCVAIGRSALETAVQSNSVAIGYDALSNATAGGYTVSIGSYNLQTGTGTVTYTTSIGYGAMQNASASNCVAIGANSLVSTTGSNNIAVGYNAMNHITTAAGNIGIGYYAGDYVNGNYNVFIGYSAGRGTTADPLNTGAFNVGIGYDVLNDIQDGTYNIVIGPQSGNLITDGTYNILIGTNVHPDAVDSSYVFRLGRGTTYLMDGSTASGTEYLTFPYDILMTGLPSDDAEDHLLAIDDVTGVVSKRSVASIGGVVTFLGLTDTPSAYTASGGFMVMVNSTPDALEFINPATYNLSNFNDDLNYISPTPTPSATQIAVFDSGTTIQGIAGFTYDSTSLNLPSGDYISFATYVDLREAGNKIFYYSSGNAIRIGDGAGTDSTTGIEHIIIGYNSGTSITNSARNIVIGGSAVTATNGSSNVAIGHYAGRYATTFASNVIIGYQAMEGDGVTAPTGSNNVAIGYEAAQFVTTFNSSIFIGYRAGQNAIGNVSSAIAIGINSGLNMSTQSWIAIGSNTMDVATTGGTNSIAIGSNAMGTAADIGDYNIAIGDSAMMNLATNYNIAIGRYAMQYTEAGTYSVAIGYNAGQYSNNSQNVYIGYRAGEGDTPASANTGQYNVAVGPNTMYSVSEGTGNIAIGYNSAPTLTTGSYNIIIGYSMAVPAADSSYVFRLGYSTYYILEGSMLSPNQWVGTQYELRADEITEYTTDAGVTFLTEIYVPGQILLTTTAGTYPVTFDNTSGSLSIQPADYTSAGYNISITGGTSSYGGTTYDGGDISIIGGLQSNASGGDGGDIFIYGGTATNVARDRGRIFFGDGTSIATLQQRTSETNIVFYDTTTGLLTYDAFDVSTYLTASPTPSDNQVAVWTGASELEGTANLTFDGTALALGSSAYLSQTYVDLREGSTRIVYWSNTNSFIVGESASPSATTNDSIIMGRFAGSALTSGNYNIIAGLYAYSDALTSAGVIALGYYAGQHATGTYNIVLGYQAYTGDGVTAPSGSNNVILGFQAGLNATSMASSVLIGYQAGRDMTGAGINYNVAIGYQAAVNMTDSTMVAVGYQALEATTVGASTVAVGPNAGGASTSMGDYCILIGSAAGNVLTGHYNISIGANSMLYSELAIRGISIGHQAGMYTDGQDNIYIGYASGSSAGPVASNTGDNNIGIGPYALNDITTGSTNIAIGYQAGDAITTGTNNIVIGYQIDTDAVGSTYQFKLGNAAYTILEGYMASGAWVGTSQEFRVDDIVEYTTSATVTVGSILTLSSYLTQTNVDIRYDTSRVIYANSNTASMFLQYNSGNLTQTGLYNFGAGVGSGSALTSGGYNIFIGTNAGNTVTTGSYNVLLGYEMDAAAGDNYQFKLGYNTVVALSGNLSTGAMALNQYGSGTITGTPAYYLAVDSSGNIIEDAGALAWTSDTYGITYSSGFVGIGSASETDKALVVSDDTYPHIKLWANTTGDVDSRISFWDGTTASQIGVIAYDHGLDHFGMNYGSNIGGVLGAGGFWINSSGFIGVNQAPDPTATFTVYGTGDPVYKIVTNNTATWTNYASASPTNRALMISTYSTAYGVGTYSAITMISRGAATMYSYAILSCEALSASNHSTRFNLKLRGTNSTDWDDVLSIDYDATFMYRNDASGDVTHEIYNSTSVVATYGWYYNSGTSYFQIHTGTAFAAVTSADFSISTGGAVYMANITNTTSGNYLYYDSTTKELTYNTTSDIRLKTNIVEWEPDSLSFLTNQRIIKFDWKDGKSYGQIGWDANMMSELMPDMTWQNNEGYWNYYDAHMRFHFHRSIKQLAERLETNEEKIERLEKRVEELEKLNLS